MFDNSCSKQHCFSVSVTDMFYKAQFSTKICDLLGYVTTWVETGVCEASTEIQTTDLMCKDVNIMSNITRVGLLFFLWSGFFVIKIALIMTLGISLSSFFHWLHLIECCLRHIQLHHSLHIIINQHFLDRGNSSYVVIYLAISLCCDIRGYTEMDDLPPFHLWQKASQCLFVTCTKTSGQAPAHKACSPREWATSDQNFRWKETSCQQTKGLIFHIDIGKSTVGSFVLSQCPHSTDKRTYGQIFVHQDQVCISISSKNHWSTNK